MESYSCCHDCCVSSPSSTPELPRAPAPCSDTLWSRQGHVLFLACGALPSVGGQASGHREDTGMLERTLEQDSATLAISDGKSTG